MPVDVGDGGHRRRPAGSPSTCPPAAASAAVATRPASTRCGSSWSTPPADRPSAASPPTSSTPRPRPPPRSCGWPWCSPSRPPSRPATSPTTGRAAGRPGAGPGPAVGRRPRGRRPARWPPSPSAPGRSPVTLEASPQTVRRLADHRPPGDARPAGRRWPPPRRSTSSPRPPTSRSTPPAWSMPAWQRARPCRWPAAPRSLDAGSPHPPAGAASRRSGAWITDDGLDAATLAQLAADGYSQVVLPADAASPPRPTNGSTAEPFTLSPAHGLAGDRAVASDADLAARFTGDPGRPGAGRPPAGGRAGPDLLREAQRHHPPRRGGGRPGRLDRRPRLRRRPCSAR